MNITVNYRRNRPPLPTDDMTQQFFAESIWWDETNDDYYRLDDHSAGAAVWTVIQDDRRSIEARIESLERKVDGLTRGPV